MNIKTLIRKIYEKFYYRLMWVSKKRYCKGGKEYYRYHDELFFSDINKKDVIKKKYSNRTENYWKEQTDYSLFYYFPQRFCKQYELIFEKFLPSINRDAIVADIGCAAGEWAYKVLPYVGKIEGYEYSDKMVEKATKRAYDERLENITFTQADARNLELRTNFDGVMLLGMLMYIDSIEDVRTILSNIFSSMKSGALLVTKDTLNCENRDVVFVFNRKTGYESVYWSKELYFDQFREVGFVLEDEVLMDEVTTRHMHFIAQGAVWKKP